MSGTPPAVPVPPEGGATSAQSPTPPASAPVPAGFAEKAAAVLFCIFCLEIGIFLLFYPWMENWSRNYLIQLFPGWRPLLTSPQFRGGLSGLGILNLFIAFGEIIRLRRFSVRRPRA